MPSSPMRAWQAAGKLEILQRAMIGLAWLGSQEVNAMEPSEEELPPQPRQTWFL